MAGFGWTDSATTTLIDDNDILEAFVYQVNLGGGDYAFEKWNSNALTYTLNVGDTNPDGEVVGAWTASLTAAIQAAIADIEAISGITFTEIADNVDGTDGADIDFWYYNNPSDGAAGYSYGVAGSGVYLDEDSVYVAGGSFDDGLAYGGINYRTVIHELLHNIGVAHPHDRYDSLPGVVNSSDPGDFSLNQNLYTVMSYNRVQQVDANGEETTGWPWTVSSVDQSFGVLGAFDIAIVQALYGANMSTATGDDIYDIPTANGDGVYFKSIWDAGGTDTFRYTGSDGVRIDLRAATLDIADGMRAGGIASRVVGVYGGFTIANGVEIENAIGGTGDDTLQGNQVANTITAGRGADTLIGGSDDDELHGNGGGDFLYGGSDDDMIWGQGGTDDLEGGSGADALYGGGGEDTLTGNADNDILEGGDKGDELYGGGGTDTLRGNDGADLLRGGSDGDDLRGGKGKDTLEGGDGADTLKGQKGDDTLKGEAGADRLEGGEGNDRLTGGAGADVFVFDGDGDEGTDRITDWDDGTDMIEISGSTTYGDLSFAVVNGNMQVTWGANKIILEGVTAGIDASDFDFV